MAKSKSDDSVFSAAVCNALRKIVVNRENAKAKLSDAIEYRKEIEASLEEMGSKKCKERSEACEEKVNTDLEIEYQRARHKSLANLLEQTIKRADEPGLFNEDDDVKTDFTRKDIAKMAEDRNQQKFGEVPRIGGTYTFKNDSTEFSGEVTSGGTKVCSVTVHACKRGDDKKYARDEDVEIEYALWELDPIDVPKDAIRVDQPKAGAKAEFANAK